MRARVKSPTERRDERATVDDPEAVLAAAARFLEARPRSCEETRRHLVAAGYGSEVVARALERLVELGILDDEMFARAWVESRDRAHPRGERALQRELSLKGVDRDLIALVLGERESFPEFGAGEAPGDRATADERAAERLLARKASTLGRIADPRQRRQRAYVLLVRNGFDSSVATGALERWFRATAEDPD